jgi:hypothetical protein
MQTCNRTWKARAGKGHQPRFQHSYCFAKPSVITHAANATWDAPNAVVVGAGIGGLATALALHKVHQDRVLNHTDSQKRAIEIAEQYENATLYCNPISKANARHICISKYAQLLLRLMCVFLWCERLATWAAAPS